jgi:hypothetical protein
MFSTAVFRAISAVHRAETVQFSGMIGQILQRGRRDRHVYTTAATVGDESGAFEEVDGNVVPYPGFVVLMGFSVTWLSDRGWTGPRPRRWDGSTGSRSTP